jgi:hypothetical protein
MVLMILPRIPVLKVVAATRYNLHARYVLRLYNYLLFKFLYMNDFGFSLQIHENQLFKNLLFYLKALIISPQKCCVSLYQNYKDSVN